MAFQWPKSRAGAGCINTASNLPNRYIALCWRPVTHVQTGASYSALYRFGRLSDTAFNIWRPDTKFWLRNSRKSTIYLCHIIYSHVQTIA